MAGAEIHGVLRDNQEDDQVRSRTLRSAYRHGHLTAQEDEKQDGLSTVHPIIAFGVCRVSHRTLAVTRHRARHQLSSLAAASARGTAQNSVARR